MTTLTKCKVCWGSYGCDLEEGHKIPVHVCGLEPPEEVYLGCSIAWKDDTGTVWVVFVYGDDTLSAPLKWYGELA